MTRQERQAASAGRRLADALLAVERYDGDPMDTMAEAGWWLRHGRLARDTKGAAEALCALTTHYTGGGE